MDDMRVIKICHRALKCMPLYGHLYNSDALLRSLILAPT